MKAQGQFQQRTGLSRGTFTNRELKKFEKKTKGPPFGFLVVGTMLHQIDICAKVNIHEFFDK